MQKARKPRTGTKAEFVRSNPNLTAAELVKLGKQQGVKLTSSYIYNIRSAASAAQPRGVEAELAERMSAPAAAPAPPAQLSQPELASLGEAFMLLLASALDKPVRNIVAEEIRRRLS